MTENSILVMFSKETLQRIFICITDFLGSINFGLFIK